ncbi:carbohydrate esterase family 4 protein [Russula earlei]|uniref:Carbohydrate esterase family 4 protein n=1 Tax=Russula earlei TaxID=71964 RepID=A0ACC0UQG0_9AGAM|nr:carbohydrate esterase family 4 protein [Russula earlei]
MPTTILDQVTLPDRWYHDDDHFAHALFKRQSTTPPSPSDFPQVGSPSWAAAYPVGTPVSSAMPQAWQNALNNAVQAGTIPNIQPSAANESGRYPVLPSQLCSNTYGCRIPGVIYDAPPGVWALSFDDGPLPPSDTLYAFLRQNGQKATHFFIGMNIVNFWPEFNLAFQTNQDDIAVHTWTHPHMTALSNADVTAQLGWSLQIIYNSTGGRLARYWRPPYGDVDARVAAIALEVFGLQTIVWNRDTSDWSLGLPGGTSPQAVGSNMQQWLSGPQNPGLIILEHELTDYSVQAFMTAYPLAKQYNWNVQSLASVVGTNGAYQNLGNPAGQPTLAPLVAGSNGSAGLTLPATTSTSSSTPPSSPTNTNSSGSRSQSTSLPASVKTGGAPPISRSIPLTLSVCTLALVFSFCLF